MWLVGDVNHAGTITHVERVGGQLRQAAAQRSGVEPVGDNARGDKAMSFVNRAERFSRLKRSPGLISVLVTLRVPTTRLVVRTESFVRGVEISKRPP